MDADDDHHHHGDGDDDDDCGGDDFGHDMMIVMLKMEKEYSQSEREASGSLMMVGWSGR